MQHPTMSLQRAAALLIAAALVACGGGGAGDTSGGDNPGGGGGPNTWLPGQAEVAGASGMAIFKARAPDGTVTGHLLNPFAVDGVGGLAAFQLRASSASAAELAIDYTPGPKVTVVLTDGGHATTTVDGVAFSGFGPLAPGQAAVAAGFLQMNRLPVAVNGKAGFLPVELAVALVPLQLGLKYATLDPLSGVADLFWSAGCGVLAGASPTATSTPRCPGPILLSAEAPLPVVLGFFPFDGEGAGSGIVSLAPAMARRNCAVAAYPGDASRGACDSLCRGACGADCEPNNCQRGEHATCELGPDGLNNGTRITWGDYDCGVHQGCIDHDDCYDQCNDVWGCTGAGAFLAAACRHGPGPTTCDGQAWNIWGTADVLLWWKGYGDFSSRRTFSYAEAQERDPVNCPYVDVCVPAGTAVTLPDGSQVPIESLVPGAEIAAAASHLPRPFTALVEQVLVHRDGPYPLDRLISASGAELEVTPEHPIWTAEYGYLMAADLQPGLHLLEVDPVSGETRQVELVAVLRAASVAGTVYNLKTSAASYLAAGLLVHNKCLARGSLVETPEGPVAVETLRPGDEVLGDRDGRRVVARVVRTYRKATVLGSLPGRRLAPGLLVTVNHPVADGGLFTEAGLLPAPAEAAQGDVFDLETSTGNYYADGVLLGAALP